MIWQPPYNHEAANPRTKPSMLWMTQWGEKRGRVSGDLIESLNQWRQLPCHSMEYYISILPKSHLVGFSIYYLELNAFLTDRGHNVRWWKRETQTFPILPSKSEWVLILRVISVTSTLAHWYSLTRSTSLFVVAMRLRSQSNSKLWRVESQAFTEKFLIVLPTDTAFVFWILSI